MWLMSLALAVNTTSSPIPQSAIGPESETEQKSLFQQGIRAFETLNFSDASYALKRFISRYPMAPQYSDAFLYLGRTEMKRGKFGDAEAPLRTFIQFQPKRLKAHLARIDLGHTYLELKKTNEAMLTALEVLNEKDSKISPDLLRASAHIVRAHAHFRNKHDAEMLEDVKQARATLDLYRFRKDHPESAIPPSPSTTPPASGVSDAAPVTTATNDSDKSDAGQPSPEYTADLTQIEPFALPTEPAIRSELEWVEIRAQDKGCAKLAAKKKLTEAQMMELTERRGTCLVEAGLILKRAFELDPLETPEDEKTAMDRLSSEYRTAFEAYFNSCRNPVDPPGRRTHLEMKRYRAELVDRLVAKCDEKRDQIVSFIDGWTKGLSENRAQGLQSLKQSLLGLSRGPISRK